MSKQNCRIAIGAGAGILLLILDGRTALSGATKGLELCINTLIPSLFPFIVLSILLTGALAGQTLTLLRPIAFACKAPRGTESLLAVSVLGGYPVGAQNISLMHSRGQLTAKQASRMLAYCNNAGPAFIFGVLGTVFSDIKIAVLLWLVHISSAFIVGAVLPGGTTQIRVNTLQKNIRMTDALVQSVKVMSLICSWVLLMRMVLAFLDVWFLWRFPRILQVMIAGFLELSNGCIRLAEIEIEGLRFIIASGFLSLGGICVTLQTASVIDGISMELYFPGKILQCCISIILCCVLQFIFPAQSRCAPNVIAITAIAATGIILSIMYYSEKNSGIPAIHGV